MNQQAIKDLLERVGKADGPNFDLEGAIARAFEPERLAHFRTAPNYTYSLDAALALVGRVLPDHGMLELFQCDDGGDWGAHWRKPETNTGYASAPALALLKAMLLALEDTSHEQ